MSAAAPPAARLGDSVAHSHALAGFVAGAVVGIIAATAATFVIGAGVAALEVATAGLATPLIIGAAAAALEFGANAYVGAKLMGMAEEEGEKLGSQHMGAASGKIAMGSANVFVNGRPAARATDAETCHAAVVAQGSRTVIFNRLPASRVGDKTACGATIIEGASNVHIGGPPVSMVPVQSEVPEWVRWAAVVASIVPALGQAARALGPALAEVEATGFARAAQTGVKALVRTLEERGGATRPLRPFAHEPMIPPKAEIKTANFDAKRPSGLDMKNLSSADRTAAKQLKKSGWNVTQREQILQSGDDFRLQPGQKSDPMYGFSSKGYAKGSDSPYWMDEPTFKDMQQRYQDPTTGKWDSAGVKGNLALPCYNKADAVYQGSLTEGQTMVTSTINPATESVTYVNPKGNVLEKFDRVMTGGGTQTAPKINTVGNILEL